MKKLISTLSVFAIAFCVARAAEEPAKPAPEATAPAPETPQLELKNKSSFALDPTMRNPFWPVGWRPASKAAAANAANPAEHAVQDISPSAFLVSSITVDSAGSFAIINGKVMNEGQVFGLQLGNQTYQLTVKAIQDGQVVLQRRDQEIIVPLRRR
ncbi:MAG TPA: hypothetical protein VGC85_03850 [Chthoniobacterales bacterium]